MSTQPAVAISVLIDVPFQLEAAALRAGDHFTFETDARNLECLGHPAGSGGFGGLMPTAVEVDFKLVI